MQNFFDKPFPLTICMWDYSWLRSGHPGGPFNDLHRCVAEAAEMGYNTLRVDVFPNLYPHGKFTFPEFARAGRLRTWGDVRLPGGYTVDVRERVVELADLCRRYGLWLGLDTWLSEQMFDGVKHPTGEEEKAARRIADYWAEALPLMREDGILERALWCAPLNEVPLFLGRKLERVLIADSEDRHEGQTEWHSERPDLDVLFMDINHWLGEAVKEQLEAESIPLCYSSLGAENYNQRVPDYYDMVDVHFMPDLILGPEDAAALEKAGAGASKFSLHGDLAAYDLALYGAAWNRACQRNYARMLSLFHNYAHNATQRLVLPSGKRLESVLTEAYGPCNFPDHPEVDWRYYQQLNMDGVRVFCQYPFSGLTLSNHAEPIFRLWGERELQKCANAFILEVPASGRGGG